MARSRAHVRTVADGVFLLERAACNAYLVVSDDDIVLIDAGLPRTWPLLTAALASVGAAPRDITALLLTHGHFDHVGMCERLRDEHGVTAHVHAADERLVRHPYRYDHEAPRWPYPFRYPAALPGLARIVAAGGLGIKGSTARPDVVSGEVIPLGGGIRPVATPGHTDGHCAFFLERQGILFTGDALVTRDPYTDRIGPRAVARAATADSAQALDSLAALAETDARLALPGHGEPWTRGIRAAVDLATAQGVD